MLNVQLNNMVQQLKLYGIVGSLDSRVRQAADATMSYEELLSMLFQDELDHRNQTSDLALVFGTHWVKQPCN